LPGFLRLSELQGQINPTTLSTEEEISPDQIPKRDFDGTQGQGRSVILGPPQGAETQLGEDVQKVLYTNQLQYPHRRDIE
jgi:hypothetical protein